MWFRELISLISNNQTLVIAISTVIYTIFTAILVIMSYRANSLTNKVIANTRRPVVIPKLHFDNEESLFLIIMNSSTFVAKNLVMRVESPKKTFESAILLPSADSRFYITDKRGSEKLTSVDTKITYQNEDGARFNSYFKLDIPPVSRRS